MKNCLAVLSFLSCCLAAGSVFAQSTVDPSQAAPSASTQSPQDQPATAVVAKLPQISDEPRTIDPRQFLPESLRADATVDFQSRSLEELVDWLRERGVNVVVQQSELANKGVMLADPISDRVEEAPIHFLLDRLSVLNIGWYLQDDIVCITHEEIAANRLTTRPYHLGELLDEQFDADQLIELIQETIDPASWECDEGQGRINQVGDMIFVRNTERNQRNVQALLRALREHGRQTLIAVTQANVLIREQLGKKVNVRFRDTPLTEALQILSKDAGVDIRLDKKSIRSTRVRESQPVTLQVENAPLDSVLNFMLGEIGLTWMIRDGVLWATAQSTAEQNTVTAVYDVRDLSADENEAWALSEAISEQMPDNWEQASTTSRIGFAKPGIMIAWGLESDQAEILRLLESYRTALRSSKVRKPAVPAEDEAITLYYRLHSNVATDLKAALPELVQPDSWQSRNPGAIGTILMLESRPELPAGKPEVPAVPLVIERKVLVVHQHRSVHEKISELVRNIENGNASNGGMHGGGMGGMGGGFGGGFF
jgi:hypothetical protein